jgi:hypothetical protein
MGGMRVVIVVALAKAQRAVPGSNRSTDAPRDRRGDSSLRRTSKKNDAAFRWSIASESLAIAHDRRWRRSAAMASRLRRLRRKIETGVLDTPARVPRKSVFGIATDSIAPLAAGARPAGEPVRLDAPDTGKLVAEPRLRADMWLGPQFTLGATAGVTLSDQNVWMVGLSLGIHSHEFGRGR